MALLIYALAAVGEIVGCFAFWAWLRLGKSAFRALPGTMSLVVFAVLLTRVDLSLAGRVNGHRSTRHARRAVVRPVSAAGGKEAHAAR